MHKNIIVYTSSHNNYDMLKGEVLEIDFEGFEFINVDDASTDSEIQKGKQICKDSGVVYLQNKGRGVQMATQTLIDFVNKNRPDCKYIICLQHDVKPITNGFFKKLSTYISDGKLDDFGAVGFNVIDRGKYTGKSYELFKDGKFTLGMIGLAHLSVSDTRKRWMSPHHNPQSLKRNKEKWSKPFIIEFPAWMVVGINVNIWNKVVTPTEEYQFHLWFPDVAMQLNNSNHPLLVIPSLVCLNQQEVKSKYGISQNSAHGAKRGEEYHFGKYSNFKAWSRRWGWDYENAKSTFKSTSEKYKGTLLYEYYMHDNNDGPLRNYEL
jgi:glycosyltransferase involved in cell wall biosynthesis